jgi:hypothetical protein
MNTTRLSAKRANRSSKPATAEVSTTAVSVSWISSSPGNVAAVGSGETE